jgi:hypothetical protein
MKFKLQRCNDFLVDEKTLIVNAKERRIRSYAKGRVLMFMSVKKSIAAVYFQIES